MKLTTLIGVLVSSWGPLSLHHLNIDDWSWFVSWHLFSSVGVNRLWVMKWKINRNYVKESTHILVLYFRCPLTKETWPIKVKYLRCLLCVKSHQFVFWLFKKCSPWTLESEYLFCHTFLLCSTLVNLSGCKTYAWALIAIKTVTGHSNITVQCQTNGVYSDVEKNYFLLPFYLATSNCGV